jgi:hypothetical protein
VLLLALSPRVTAQPIFVTHTFAAQHLHAITMEIIRRIRSQASALRNRMAIAALCSLPLLSTISAGAPYIPANDSTPLERLAANGVSARDSQADGALRTLLKRDPTNVELATRLAQRYIARARIESDPRLLGQAQAALSPWWSISNPPTPVLLARATIRQSNHDFVNARSDLERVVKHEPKNAQAWLTLATVQTVTADFTAATDSCDRLRGLTQPLIVATCAAAIDGVRGQATKAYDALNAALQAASAARNASIGVRIWALTLQAELAERLSRAVEADRLYRESLALDPADTYTIAMYADFLIDANRAQEVLALIPATARADILLLRRAIAAKRVAAPDASKLADDLARRFNASRARGDRLHLREESRFALLLKNSPNEALALALDNWRVQKEPLDARIALEAAVAMQQPKAVSEVINWLDTNALQGAKFAELRKQLRAQS